MPTRTPQISISDLKISFLTSDLTRPPSEKSPSAKIARSLTVRSPTITGENDLLAGSKKPCEFQPNRSDGSRAMIPSTSAKMTKLTFPRNDKNRHSSPPRPPPELGPAPFDGEFGQLPDGASPVSSNLLGVERSGPHGEDVRAKCTFRGPSVIPP